MTGWDVIARLIRQASLLAVLWMLLSKNASHFDITEKKPGLGWSSPAW